MSHRNPLIALCLVMALAGPVCTAGIAATQGEVVGGLTRPDAAGPETTALAVCVRDNDDQSITGLEREQFRVMQDGEELPITSFAAFLPPPDTDPTRAGELFADPAAEAPAATTVPDEHIEPVYIIIFIDNPNLLRSERNRILRQLQSFARAIASEQVQIMVVFFGDYADILQPFTSDDYKVVNALRDLRMADEGQDALMEERAKLQRSMNRAFQRRGQASTGMQQELRNLYENIELYMDEERRVVYRSLDGVYEVMSTLSGMSGRKHLIYVSNGLPTVVARDLLHELSTLQNRTNRSIMSMMPYNLSRRYEALADSANSFEIAVHPFDASGADHGPKALGDGVARRSSTAHRIDRENKQAALRLLAERTGGVAIVNTDDFAVGCERLRTDILTYYSLGFNFAGSAADKVHVIDVQLNLEQEHQLRYRRTLVEKSLPSRVQDEVTSALIRDVPGNQMGIKLTPGSWVEVTSDQWMLPLVVSFPVQSVALTAEGEDYVGSVMVFLATRDFQGQKTDMVRKQHELRVPISEYEHRRKGFFDINHRLLLSSGGHNVAVAVLDQTTNTVSYDKAKAASPDAY